MVKIWNYLHKHQNMSEEPESWVKCYYPSGIYRVFGSRNSLNAQI